MLSIMYVHRQTRTHECIRTLQHMIAMHPFFIAIDPKGPQTSTVVEPSAPLLLTPYY